MQAIYHFGHKILCDAYVMISKCVKLNTLINKQLLCNAYVIISEIDNGEWTVNN